MKLDKKNWIICLVRVIIIFLVPIILALLCFNNLDEKIDIEFDKNNSIKIIKNSEEIENFQKIFDEKMNNFEIISKLTKFDLGVIQYNIYFKNEIYGIVNVKNSEDKKLAYVILGIDSKYIDYVRIDYNDGLKLIYPKIKGKNVSNYIDSTFIGKNPYIDTPPSLQLFLYEDKLNIEGKIIVEIKPLKRYYILIFLFFLATWIAAIKIYQEIIKLIKNGIHKNNTH